MKKKSGARGRIVPQSLSTDPRFGRLSLKGQVLFPLLWINCDDQGRFSGDPEEIKYAACPSVKEISADEISALLQDMQVQNLLTLYDSTRSRAIQMLDWWEEQRLQWAYPSQYTPPQGWADCLRYHVSPKEIVTDNWPPPAWSSLNQYSLPLTTPSLINNEEEERRRSGRGSLPNSLPSKLPIELGINPTSSLTGSDLYNYLLKVFPLAFGHQPNSRETAFLQDFSKEISAAGGATAEQVYDAFKEACVHAKFSISYVRAVLMDWKNSAK